MNIVFDLGGVVFNWQPEALIRRVFPDTRKQALVQAEILGHDDWVELDRGSIVLDDAIARAVARTGLPDDTIARLFDEVPPSLTPIQGTIDLIRSIRGTDSRLFVLSNMGLASMAYLEEQHDIWDLFDGIVISSRIGKVKPEAAIYEYLLTEYQLEAAETVFIDDLNENLAAASRLGIQTIRFVDPSQCRQELAELHCL